MKRSYKIPIYFALAVTVYSFLAFSFNTPAEWRDVITVSNKDLGIISYPVKSSYQEGPTEIQVLLPKDMNKDRAYRVLYILPVSPQKWDRWWTNGLRTAARLDIANRYNVICVYPSFSRSPWYADHPENIKIRQESYFLNDVVPFIDAKFNTQQGPEGRYLLGFSRSGFGAVSLLLRHPDIFGGAASWDGTLVFDHLDNPWAGLKEVFGSEENLRGYYIPALIPKRAGELKRRAARIALTGYSFPNTKLQSEQVHQLFLQEGVPHTFDLSTRRKHSWNSGWMEGAVRSLLEGEPRLP